MHLPAQVGLAAGAISVLELRGIPSPGNSAIRGALQCVRAIGRYSAMVPWAPPSAEPAHAARGCGRLCRNLWTASRGAVKTGTAWPTEIPPLEPQGILEWAWTSELGFEGGNGSGRRVGSLLHRLGTRRMCRDRCAHRICCLRHPPARSVARYQGCDVRQTGCQPAIIVVKTTA